MNFDVYETQYRIAKAIKYVAGKNDWDVAEFIASIVDQERESKVEGYFNENAKQLYVIIHYKGVWVIPDNYYCVTFDNIHFQFIPAEDFEFLFRKKEDSDGSQENSKS